MGMEIVLFVVALGFLRNRSLDHGQPAQWVMMTAALGWGLLAIVLGGPLDNPVAYAGLALRWLWLAGVWWMVRTPQRKFEAC